VRNVAGRPASPSWACLAATGRGRPRPGWPVRRRDAVPAGPRHPVVLLPGARRSRYGPAHLAVRDAGDVAMSTRAGGRPAGDPRRRVRGRDGRGDPPGTRRRSHDRVARRVRHRPPSGTGPALRVRPREW